jgi:hypothetical protein
MNFERDFRRLRQALRRFHVAGLLQLASNAVRQIEGDDLDKRSTFCLDSARLSFDNDRIFRGSAFHGYFASQDEWGDLAGIMDGANQLAILAIQDDLAHFAGNDEAVDG